MSGLLAGETAVVTGGSSGIGRGIALEFASNGANVVVADVIDTPREGGEPTHERIAAEFDVASTFVDCDVRELDDHMAAADAAEEIGGCVDIWVNNAGVSGGPSFREATGDDFDDMMAVNAKGALFGSQVAAAAMDAGSIINLSSLAGMKGYASLPVYTMTKGAVRLLTYSLADELSPTIRVNAIHPGAIATSMSTKDDQLLTDDNWEEYAASIPLERIGKPEDIGKAAVFLASDLADYITGHSLVVDGGLNNIR